MSLGTNEKNAEREIVLDLGSMLGFETIADGTDTSRPVAFGLFKDSDGDGLPDVFDPDPNDPDVPNEGGGDDTAAQ